MCCFFFFQAEDGIRDIGVTGVQTCALPIYHPFEPAFLDDQIQAQYEADVRLGRAMGAFAGLAVLVACLGLFGLAALTARSEERRVGKECRSRWSPYH